MQIYRDCSPLAEADELSSNPISAPRVSGLPVLIDSRGKTLNLLLCPECLHC